MPSGTDCGGGDQSTPLVSIIIPTLNRRGLLMQTLDSLCDQTYPHWEAVVVDDGSTDGTDDMMGRFCRWEPRIRYMHRQGDLAGANVCRNQGVEASRGEYIIFLDSDDLLMPHCLEGRVKVMEASPDLDLAVFLGEVFAHQPGDRGILTNVFTVDPDLERFLALDCVWSTPGPIWRNQALGRVGRWLESLTRLQDWEFHVRAITERLRYAPYNVQDYYVRSGEPEQARVSPRDWTWSHVEPLAGAVPALVRRIIRNGMLTDAVRWSCARMVWWLATQCVVCGARHHAAALWREASSLGLVNRRRWVEGTVLLQLAGAQALRSAMVGRLLPRWQAYRGMQLPVPQFHHPVRALGLRYFGLPVTAAEPSSLAHEAPVERPSPRLPE